MVVGAVTVMVGGGDGGEEGGGGVGSLKGVAVWT